MILRPTIHRDAVGKVGVVPRQEDTVILIATKRLTLVPATVALARAEIEDRAAFARLLAATVPDNWPPESTADALPLFLGWLEAAPEEAGWFAWYALATRGAATAPPMLVGGGGFLGPPKDGRVQIGYSVLTQHQRQGYATELVRGLVRWAFAQPGVSAITAETEWANPTSVRVLEKVGFSSVGPASEFGGLRFTLVSSASDAEPGAPPDRFGVSTGRGQLHDMRHHFTPPADKLWKQIPAPAQEAILAAVWCGHCGDARPVLDHTGVTTDEGDIRLQGFCANCGHVVVRIVETSER